MKKIINKIRENKIKYGILGIIFILASITLGTAIISSTLNINGRTKIEKSSWIIYFDDVRKSSDSVVSDKDARIVDFGKTRIEFNANLKSIGDFYEFTVYTVNDGTIDAMVDSVEKSTLTEEQQKYLTFEVKYDNGVDIQRCDELNAGTRRRIKAIVKYKEGIDINDYPTVDVDLNLYFNINYVQKDDACPPRPVDDQKVLTIVPNGGVYNGRTDEVRIYMNEGETYNVASPTRDLYNFTGWEKNPEEGTYTFNNNTFTMGKENVTLTAGWEEGDYVARIMNKYYPTIQQALDEAALDWEDNTVHLLRSTEESPTNNTSKRVKFDLEGFTVTGTFTNSSVGDLQIVNGRFENPEEGSIVFKNYGKLTMGEDDNDVEVESSISISGESTGLQNYAGSEYYIYDGYLQGVHALVGGYTGKASGYYLIVDYRKAIQKDRVYLVKNNNRAVAKTLTNGELYYYNLQSAIEEVEGNKSYNTSLTDSDYIIYAIRNFEGAYELEVDNGSRIFFDTAGYNIDLGENITNNGYFNIYNSTDNISTLKVSKTLTNSSELSIDNITFTASGDSNIINNTGKLNVENSTLHSKFGYDIYNTGSGEVTLDQNTLLQSDDTYAIYNAGNNLKIGAGTIYGIYNSGNLEINGGTYIPYKNKTQNTYYTRYTNGIYNDGTIKMTNGTLHNTLSELNGIVNRGTYNYYGGDITSNVTLIQNSSGTFNVLDGEIESEGVVITNGTINVNGGNIISSTDTAVTGNTNIAVTNGTVQSETGTAINISGTATVSGGTVIGKTNGISTGTFNMSSGTVTSEGTGVTASNSTVSGGKIESTDNALATSNITMTGGQIISTDNTGLTINNSALLTGGSISGDMYGAYSKGEITLGEDDGEVSVTSPVIIGNSYGLYLEGTENNFYDGILKGQIDGYTNNTFTGLPLGGYVLDGEEEIDGNHYETDFVDIKENWLRVGDVEYNSLDAASEAISESGTIYVIKDIEVNFTQEFKNSDTLKNITLDLNGHEVTTTQNITNKDNISLTITDSDTNKRGKLSLIGKTGFINNGELIIDKGNFTSTREFIFTNNESMRVLGGKFTTSNGAIRNAKNLSIEGGIIEANVGVNNSGGTTNMGGGEMTVTEYGIYAGTVVMTNGNIHSGYRGISEAAIHIIDGEVHAGSSYALYSYWDEITVDEGNIESEQESAIKGHHKITINDGHIVGIRGIENDGWYDGVWAHYEDIIINDGTIVGTTYEGIHMRGGSNKLEVNNGHITGNTYGIINDASTYVYDGYIEGKTHGIYNYNYTQLGRDEGNISITNPIVIGGEYGVYNDDSTHDSRFVFYDGIIKGRTDGHYGLVTRIPDATMVKDDYEFINRIEFQTEYIVEKGDFLRVGDRTFNSINKAAAYANDGDTIYLTNDVTVNFEQSFPSSKTLTFDLDGHSLIMTNTLNIGGTVTIKDDSGEGSINNLKEDTITNNGTLTIESGTIINDKKVAIVNKGTLNIDGGLVKSSQTTGVTNTGTLNINDGTIEGTMGLMNNGTTVINGGKVEGKDNVAINSSRDLTINGGTVTSSVANAIDFGHSGTTTVNGGTIKSTSGVGIYIDRYSGGTLNVTGGEIEGSSNGIDSYGGHLVNISGGHIKGVNNAGLVARGTSNITGGVIEGATYGIYSSGNTTIGEDDGTVSIDEPVLKGDLYGLYIETGTLNFNDGILKGITDAYYGQITNIPNRTEIFYDQERIGNYDYHTAYLLTETVIAINTTTNVEYTNLQDAIDECKTDETVKLLANVPLYYEVTNNNNDKVTIDMNGYRITTNKRIINNKTLKLENNSETESFIRTSTGINLITNTGTLETDNVELINNSASNYVINNTGLLKMNDSKVTGYNCVTSNNEIQLTNTNITANYTGINNSNKMTIDGGNIAGGNYAVYSNSNKEMSVSNCTLNGTYYNQGGNTTTFTNVTDNSSIQNNGSTLISNNSTFNSSVYNTGTCKIKNESIVNGVISSNSGTMEIDNSIVDSTSTRAVVNSGSLTISDSTIRVNSGSSDTRIISNTGTLNISNNSIIKGGDTNLGGNYIGIYNYGSGIGIIEESDIQITVNNTVYGVYSDSSTASLTMKSGNLEVEGNTAYGAYINTGTFTMGEMEEGPNAGTENADVSQENPRIYVNGHGLGVGVKKLNANFNFYDGIIWASRYAKPETTTNVELNYEVTTYVDADTGYEYALLEYMRNDYEGNTVALLNGVYYRSVSAAIDKCEEGDEILLLKSVSEDLTIGEDKHVKINLNGHSITTKVINNGEFNIYNGSLQNVEDNTVVNNGTLIIGLNDGTVSSTNVRIISETTAIVNNGTVKMYDGYIQGVPSIQGQINEIPDLSRIYTERTDQTERKYLQSLSRDAIINKETKLIITIDPNNGVYEGSKEVQEVYLYYEDEYELKSVSKNGCEFVEWEVSDPTVLSGTGTEDDPYIITVGLSDIVVTAKWRVSENAVAHIGNEYYTTIAQAIEAAKDNDEIELIKDVTEDVTNNKNVTMNLHGNKITGEFINNGELRIVDGTIENPDGTGIVNNKKLTLGYNDGNVVTDSVKIIGTSLGLENNGSFNFYDGYIEGEVALLGRTDSVPQGYFLYNERVNEKQRVYLIGNPANAVAVIEEGGTQYFFSLQDAINTATVSGSEIFIVRDFEASYPITVSEGADILINMNSYNITTGNDITNNGTLKIYDTSETKGSITSARPIVNNGTLTIEDVSINETNNVNNAINSTAGSTLNIKNSIITAKTGYAVSSYGHLKLEGTYQLKSDDFALEVYGENEEIATGTIEGIGVHSPLTLGSQVIVNGHGEKNHNAIVVQNTELTVNGSTINNTANAGIHNDSGSSTITLNDATINAPTGLYCNSGTTNYYMNGGTITSSNIGVRMQADNCHFTMDEGEVTGVNYGIYTYGYHNHINVNGTVKATNGIGLRDERDKGNTHNNNSIINLNGGLVQGTTYGVMVRYSTVTIENTEVKTTSTNRDHYAYYSDWWNYLTLNDGAFLNAPNASGMRSETTTTMNEGSRIYAGANNGFGVRGHYTVFTMNGGSIEAPGTQAYGILCNDNYESLLTMNDGSITSGYVGLGLYDTDGSYDRIFNMKSGTVTGDTYGIYVNNNYTITIGHEEEELSTEIPYVSGGLYGIYKSAGTSYFYNGRLRGSTYGFNDEFNSIRSKKNIAEVYEKTEDMYTVSTDEVSSTAIANTAKKGNGYARITYVGEDETCANQVTNYDYTGIEEMFAPICDGTYKLETWGAQGGYASDETLYGGYGSYSVGEVDLQIGDTLYINVGGQGANNSYGSSAVNSYNGGGIGSTSSSTLYCGGGGGATHIATESGLLSSLEDNKEAILIVSGGGGGAHKHGTESQGIGAHAGGYTGLDGTTQRWTIGTGGTQTSGGTGYGTAGIGSFGQGGNGTANSGGGGGAGYYGGGGGNGASGGGGSGYIGNPKLKNKAMYAYNAITEKSGWIINYLVERDGFLEVDGEVFNSFEDASQYIIDNLNGTGTIKVISDASILEESTILEADSITIDLNGHTVKTSKAIANNTDLTIVDSSLDNSGLIECTKDSAIKNNGSVTLDGIHIKATGYNAIYGATGTGNIVISNNSMLEGARGILLDSAQKVTIEDTEILATTDAIRSSARYAEITINEGTTITSSDIGIRLQAADNVLTFNDGEITAVNYGIYTAGERNVIDVNDGVIKATSYDGIRDDVSKNTGSSPTHFSKININGGLVQGARHGMYGYYAVMSVYDAEVKTISKSVDHYAIVNTDWATTKIYDGAKITGASASGIYNNSSVYIYGGELNAAGYGIYGDYNNVYMSGGKIKSGTYGIYCGNYNYKNIVIEGGEIEADNIGIALVNGSSDTRQFTITGGSVKGNLYGVYQTVDYRTTIGSVDEELSTTEPLISGGLYGFYKTAGTANYYNGRLRGYVYGYNDYFDNVRTKMDIVEENETDSTAVDTKTLNAEGASTTATSNYAKIGNGYAKITYIGEDESCINQVTDFDYTGGEQTFTPTCAGKYSLEVWGASGGGSSIISSDSSKSGAGGYSYGEIDLTTSDTLYINVGGQGRYGSGASAFGGPKGGYNGGGDGGTSISCSGGGATHIATSTGVLSSLSENRESVLIVAGGGGGSDDPGGDSSQGGSGGGYIGSPAYVGTTKLSRHRHEATPEYDGGCGMGGTQTEGFAFGQGESVTFNTDTGGAGGGWYGGYVTNNWSGGAGGGSGYIGNSRLSNKVMYAYNATVTSDEWINNYLAQKEDFIQVGAETFNSIDDAAAYIIDNLSGVGTMTVIKDVTIQEAQAVPADIETTLDLNGHTIIMSKTLTNSGDLTITDSSLDKSGLIDNKKTDTITNNNHLTVDGAYLKGSDTAIWGRTGDGNVIVKGNSVLEGPRGILLDSPQKLTVENTTITTTSDSIRTNATNSKVTINSGTVINSGDIGIRLQSHTTNLVVNDGNITGANYGIYSYGNGNKITTNGGNITGTAADGIREEYDGSNIELNILGGTITGKRYGIYKYASKLVVENAEVKTNSINRDEYALYCRWGTTTLKDGAFINAPLASGVWAEDNITMETGSKIYAGQTGSYGIAERWCDEFNIAGGEIETPGGNAIGIYSYDNVVHLNMTNGSIKSGNIGIYLNVSSNVGKTVTVTGGSIEGDTYGIYQVQNYTTVIGDSEEELSTSNPYISGGLYGIYNSAGTVSFYNGRLRGYTYGYSNTIENIREEKIIFEESEENLDEPDILTYSVSNVSSTPTSKTPKSGNGHARITYIGETNGTCTANQEYEFSYTGGEQTFTPDCEGLYTLEVWGAQGGSYGKTGGYGGYSTGEITLSTSETLYINVGGQPSGTAGGYNGGGTGGANYYARGGGGATHIATSTGILSSLENNKESILIVAGGGGGSDYWNSGSDGGSGGGFKGTNGNLRSTSSYAFQVAQGGTQEVGGAGAQGACIGTSGTFGQGGSHCEEHGGGGGGGYYGGGGGAYYNSVVGSGAGGSGYINNSRLSNKSMYGYNVQISYARWINNYLSDPKQFMINIDQDKTYSNVQKAFNEVADGETLQMMDDASIAYDVTSKDDIAFTLDMNGYNLETTKQITNNSNLKIINTGTINIDPGDDEEEIDIDQSAIIYENEVVTNGLKIYYDGSNPGVSPNSIWKDLSGNGNDASTSEVTYNTNSYEFNGTDSYIPIKRFDNTEYTWEVTFKSNDLTNRNVIVANYHNGGCGIKVENSKLVGQCYIDGEYRKITSTNDIKTNTKYKATLTMNNGVFKLYLDGTLIDTYSGSTYTTPIDNTILMLGADPSGSLPEGSYLNGNIYSFRLYDRALSDSEISKNNEYDSLINDNNTDNIVLRNYNYNFTGEVQEFTAPADGTYKIEAWGAQGGSTEYSIGGKGAYTAGNINLNKGDKLYIYVGETAKVDSTSNAAYNGGGLSYGEPEYGRGGGGATDIRLNSGNWNNSISLASRIMVAGAGGGSYSYESGNFAHDGGAGGTINGESGEATNTCTSEGGTQTSGGSCSTYSSVSGSFGQGGNAVSGRASGGGSGYYGGAARYDAPGSGSGAGGGSSYISGHAGSIAIESESDTSPKSGCTSSSDSVECSTHYSGKVFTKTVMKAGNESMPNYDGTGSMTGNTGNGYVKITTLSAKTKDNTSNKREFDYEGKEQVFVAPLTGDYKLETWGAQGGDATEDYVGGYGAYSTGTVHLNQGDKLYINVGGQGDLTTDGIRVDVPGGYNGGGNSEGSWTSKTNATVYETSGGGATHIATKSGLLSTLENDLDKVLIVSGGGGGGFYFENGYYNWYLYTVGGHAGGISSTVRVPDQTNIDDMFYTCTGATQSTAGSCIYESSAYGAGSFGHGANKDYGGGAGLYGGHTGTSNYTSGGGTSYIGNTSLTDKHMTCYDCVTSNDESTKTISTNKSSLIPLSNQAKIGHGYAIITYLPVITDFKQEFAYTGNEQVFTAPVEGDYKLETWGAQGGDAEWTSEIVYNGGYGAYSTGKVHLTQGEKLYINVGGSGADNCSTADCPGGYNGGGDSMGSNGGTYGSTYRVSSGSGGGATSITKSSGLLSTFENKQNDIVIVSGGGGGSLIHRYGDANNWWKGYGGSGGGAKSGIGSIPKAGRSIPPTAATQTEAGVGYDESRQIASGSFGQGQHGNLDINIGYEAGAGGGFYGGGASNYTSSSGGSGYIGNSILTDKQMVMYSINLNDISESASTKTLITTEINSDPIPNTAKIGDGYAIVSYIPPSTTQVENFDYTGDFQTFTAPQTGEYTIKAWGASGGNATNASGGKGGYTSGKINLVKDETIYIYVGGQGLPSQREVVGTTAGGYNGGGSSYISRNSCSQENSSGGGSTDIRLTNGEWNNNSSLASRIMVAGGGGGAQYEYCSDGDHSTVTGGNAGGLEGQAGEYVTYGGFSNINPTGGTQTTGGQSIYDWQSTTYDSSTTGSFGIGATSSDYERSSSGGGSGYYGGASGGWQPGAGGSSYISGYTGSVAISSEVDTTPKTGCTNGTTNVECSYHYSGKIFANPVMKAGNETMPTHDGSGTMTGNEGDGFAKITYMGNSSDESNTPIVINDTNWIPINQSDFSANNNKVYFHRSYQNNYATVYYKDSISFTSDNISNNSKRITGDVTYWHDWTDGSSLGTLYVGLASTNENRIDDFEVYQTYNINNREPNRIVESFELNSPSTAGNYYLKAVLYHNDADIAYTIFCELSDMKIITNNSSGSSDPTVISKPSKITNSVNTTLFVNNGKLDIENVDFDTYNMVSGSSDSELKITNSSIRATNTAITSLGTIDINNSTITAAYGVESKNSILVNNSRIRGSSQGIINSGDMEVNDSIITGSTYGVYDNSSSRDNTISDSTIKSSSISVYKNSTGLLTLDNNTITGSINNTHASGTLNVNDGSVTGQIANAGTSTYTKVPITYTSNYAYEENLINNTGTLYMDESDVTFNSTYGSGSSYYTTALYNRGTTTSYKTNYKTIHTNNRFKWMLGIRNTGLLTSTDDTIEITGAGASYALHNNSSNDSVLNNITINSHDNGAEIYAIRNAAGKLTVNGGTINMNNNLNTIMIYTSGTSNTIITDATMTSNNNTNASHIIYMQDAGGTVSITRGTYSVDSNANALVANVDSGTLNITSGTFSANAGSTGYGIKINGGNVTIESGTLQVNGSTAYGIYMSGGTYTQGILDDSGFENANVSTTDPLIEAIGTTSGTGISMGGATFNFYEGKIVGSTTSRVAGDIVSRTPNSFQVKTDTDERGYSYSILEFIK